MARLVALVLACSAMVGSTIAAAEVSLGASVNAPLRWEDREAVAGSVHVGFAQHHAIRATAGTFAYHDNVAAALVGLALEPEAEGPSRGGRVTEMGVGYQWYARRLWSGPVLEGGLVRRTVDTVEDYRLSGPEHVATDTVGYAARGLVGWSWTFGRHVFIATSVGLSVGRYAGTETTAMTSYDSDYTIYEIARTETSCEFYLRIGGVIDL